MSPSARAPYPSSASSSASSDDDDDRSSRPPPPTRRSLLPISSDKLLLHPALPSPSTRLASHPWPFTSQSPPIQRPSRLPISTALPHEILIHILRSLSSPADLRRALLVSKAWCQCGVELLWHKPSFPSTSCLIKMLVSLASKNQTFPYISFIRRLNFSSIADHITDHILLRLVNCSRLERLTLSGCSAITDSSVIKILSNSPDLVALDLSECKLVSNQSIIALGQYCHSIQGLNLSGCRSITDVGLRALHRCKAIRRLKLKSCEKITDATLSIVATSCPLLLELDLVGCRLISNTSLWMLWKHSSHLRELSLSGCAELSDGGFPSSSNPALAANGHSHPLLLSRSDWPLPSHLPLPASQLPQDLHHQNSLRYVDSLSLLDSNTPSATLHNDPATQEFMASLLPSSRRIEEASLHFDHIRFLDLTSLIKLTDASLDGIIRHMPRIRNLVLAKCVGLTDEALNSICSLGKYLHYLHLGHVSSLTDRAVIRVARSCTRLRYIDLACCNNLTDMSVFELAQSLPRLKRIGLVRVTNITDQSVYTLVERSSLERIHLSYCDNISVGAIHWLLQRLQRLTHLSLTGVPAFRRTDLQAWCRAPPKDFNAHQRQAFCVYSGKGVNELRYYLAALYISITAGHSRGRVGQPALTNNAPTDEENANSLTLSSAPIGTNLAVFNTMPDPRTMAAAMAEARQQTNPQLYSYGSRRRELRLPERASRVALSDFLHQGLGPNANAAVISGNGQLLSLPSLPRQAARRFIQANGGTPAQPNPPTTPSNGRGPGHQLAMQIDPLGRSGSSSPPDLARSHSGQGSGDRSLVPLPDPVANNVGGENGLRSPIPLYGSPIRPRPPSSNLRQPMVIDDELASGSGPSAGSGPSSDTMPNTTVTEPLQHQVSAPSSSATLTNGLATPHLTSPPRDLLRIPTHHHHHPITRRRSDVEMAFSNGGGRSSPCHHRHSARRTEESTGMSSQMELGGDLGPSGAANGGSGSSSSRLNLDIPDRTDSISPIDISDDERPPP